MTFWSIASAFFSQVTTLSLNGDERRVVPTLQGQFFAPDEHPSESIAALNPSAVDRMKFEWLSFWICAGQQKPRNLLHCCCFKANLSIGSGPAIPAQNNADNRFASSEKRSPRKAWNRDPTNFQETEVTAWQDSSDEIGTQCEGGAGSVESPISYRMTRSKGRGIASNERFLG